MLNTKYTPGKDVGPLESWDFDNPASDYRIVRDRCWRAGMSYAIWDLALFGRRI